MFDGVTFDQNIDPSAGVSQAGVRGVVPKKRKNKGRDPMASMCSTSSENSEEELEQIKQGTEC